MNIIFSKIQGRITLDTDLDKTIKTVSNIYFKNTLVNFKEGIAFNLTSYFKLKDKILFFHY